MQLLVVCGNSCISFEVWHRCKSVRPVREWSGKEAGRKREGTCYRAHFTQLAASSGAGVDTARCLLKRGKEKSGRTEVDGVVALWIDPLLASLLPSLSLSSRCPSVSLEPLCSAVCSAVSASPFVSRRKRGYLSELSREIEYTLRCRIGRLFTPRLVGSR